MIHNGTFTLTNPKTGQHRTFRVHTWDRESGGPCQVLSLLTGPENTTDYTAFAFIDNDGVKLFRRFQSHGGSQNQWSQLARVFFARVVGGYDWCREIQVLESRACVRCNRKLTTPESIQAGIGPECAAVASGC